VFVPCTASLRDGFSHLNFQNAKQASVSFCPESMWLAPLVGVGKPSNPTPFGSLFIKHTHACTSERRQARFQSRSWWCWRVPVLALTRRLSPYAEVPPNVVAAGHFV
jgi:hypothetical protein